MTTHVLTNGANPTELTLEQKVDTLIWLHTETSIQLMQVAHALAALLAQQMIPQVQQGILAQLTTPQPGTLLGVSQPVPHG
jgi:hypothetical protein